MNEAVVGKKISVSDMAVTGMCIALTLVATAFINVKLPIAANGGLIHLGNVPLFIAAILFNRRTGALAGRITETRRGVKWNVFAIAVACVIKIAGYYIAEGMIYGNRKAFSGKAGMANV